MSIVKTTIVLGRPVGRLISITLALSLFYSASAFSINPLIAETSAEAQQHLENLARKQNDHYTDKPTKVYYGKKPGRDPIGRGGIWTAKLRADLALVRRVEQSESPWSEQDLMLATSPIAGMFIIQMAPGGDGGGGSLPGEGGGSGGGTGGSGGSLEGGGATTGGSSLNTNTGNRYVSYPIVGWSSRGESGVHFSLNHNSKGTYSFDLGKGWSHGYDVKISHTPGSSAIVRYGDGKEIPYTESGGVFNAPAGVHSTLVKNIDNTWTITSKDRSKMEFNTDGRLIAVKDANSNTVSINRNNGHKILSISDSTGRSLTFSYTANGLIETITDPTSRVWTLVYNSNNDMTSLMYPSLNGQSHTRNFSYDSQSNIITETDLRGKIWTLAYDSSERLTSFTNPLGQVSTWTFGTASVIFTQPNGKTIIHNYSNGLVASKVDQAGFSTAYVYDSDRNVTSFTDKRGKIWTSTFDGNGNLLTNTNPLGKTTTYTYSAGHDLITATDPLGNVSTFTYDSNGNLLTEKDALNRTSSTLTYNTFGEVLTSSDALGRQSQAYYSSQGDVVQSRAPGNVDSWANFDVLGRMLTATDAAGSTTSLTYDSWGRVSSVTEPGGAVSTISYDLEGALVSATDPLGRTDSRILDDLGRTLSATNAKNETTSYVYNNVGSVTSITNGRGYARSYTYTDRGQVASLTMADGTLESWVYNANGENTAYTNPLGQTINYIFDDAGQMTGVDYPAGMTDTTFSYDNAGRQISMVDGTGTSSWSFNSADEITGLTTPQGSTSYTYNLAGQIATMVEAGVGTTSTSYDAAGRPISVTDAFGDVSSYIYDTAGRISRMNNPNGTYEEYSYDSRNRVASINTKNSSNVVIQSRSYTFDLASQLAQVIEGPLTTNFAYDSIGQLTSETKSSGYSANYSYDANGNRLSRTVNGVTENYSYDAGDKLLAVSGGTDPRTYAYDMAGRTTAILRTSGTTSFTYDYESRVTSVARPGMVTNSFSYNGLDTRVGMTDSSGTKSFKRNGIGVTAPVLSDGIASFTPSGEVRDGVKTTYSSALKNADIQTNSAQSVVASKVYDAFGSQLSSTGAWMGQFQYAGMFGYQQDSDTGLKLLGHRYYDSSTGRFLTRDPIKDGQNWYSYCENNPLTYADDFGYAGRLIIRAIEFAGKHKRKLRGFVDVNQAKRMRQQGKDVVVSGRGKRRVAREIEDSVDGETIYHSKDAHSQPSNPAWDHYQTNGKKGHTFIRGGVPVTASTAAMLDEYDKSIEEKSKVKWGLLEWVPYLGEAILAAELLGEWMQGLGKKSRARRAAAFDRALAVD